MIMWIVWIYYSGIVFFVLSPVQGTNRREPLACNCNGKAISCIWDADGPRCLNCQDNTEGRHCEKCKEGFYHQRAGDACLPCSCNSAGSSSPACDAAGVCSCKRGVRGDKCDRCDSGAPVTPIGCTQSCWTQGSSQSLSGQPECLSCFCYGHSQTCSPTEGYSVHTISSSFSSGPEGWRAASAPGVRFQWSSRLQSLEVFSDSSVPVYLLAPASYLGNQRLSYGQTLSFSLRLDWGARHASPSDVVLEGAGLRVAAPLGDLHQVIPCGRKTTYSFRLDESPDSKWQPALTSLQFQTLLQNVTTIKIRGTFGRRSRSYLDDVQLVSARQGPGTPAGWVRKCSCPVGHEGQFCERCAAGYRIMDPARGPFSPCIPCNCLGDCNADTGECLPGDDSSSILRGVDCSVMPGTSNVRCDRCSPGLTGPRCNMCEDGFYGDPLGESGPRRPCQRCQCNGNVDPNAVGNCHHRTGQCLRCLNHTKGFFCESCQDGFHRSHASDSCKACGCSPLGSSSSMCHSSGQCLCRETFEGLKCDRPTCPSCFDRVKQKVEVYVPKLHELEGLLQKMESGAVPANSAQLQRHIQLAELLLADMQMTSNQLTDTESGLLGRLEELSQAQSRGSGSLQAVSDTMRAVSQQEQQYQRRVSDINLLLQDVRHQLLKAKTDIRNAELALRDDNGDTNSISSLAEKAVNLAKKQQGEAEMIEQMAKSTLAEVEKAQGLMRPVLLGEDKIAELVSDLQIGFKRNSTHVTGMKKQAAHLSSSAEQESRTGEEALKRISRLEPLLFDGVQGLDGVASDLETLKDRIETSLPEYQDLKASVEAERSGMSDLLAKGDAAQQIHNQLLKRANAAQANADGSLMGITRNMEGLLDVHSKLEGFSKQLSTNRAEAERSMERLGDIAAAVRGAVGSNTQSLDILGSVQGDYRKALGMFRKLGDAVAYTEELPPTLRASHDMLKNVATLADDMNQLEAKATSRMKELAMEADRAKQREMEAREASAQAAGTYGFVRGVKDSVDQTLRDVDALLSTTSSPGMTGSTDRKSYSELELSIADTRRMVTQQLLPRLQKLDEMEASQMAKAMSLNADIDNILLDIRNLQDIQRTIPVGCFNAQPIESP